VRFLRLGPAGSERPALLLPGADPADPAAGARAYDLSSVTPDIDGAFVERATDPAQRAAWERAARSGELPELPTAGVRTGAPIAAPGKVVCIGLNYRDHAAETGAAIPTEPIVFLKTPDTVVGPDDEVLVPRGSEKTDYEVELAVVIGRTARYLADEDAAAEVIAGYTIANDVSERAWQMERGGTWDKGKNCETFCPLGPWLVTADEVADPQALGLRLSVNGEVRQDGTTADMIFGVRHLVRYLSGFMVLRPGDVIVTGTPAGVAMGSPDIPFLAPGDVMELSIDGLGSQRQTLGKA